jgi:geranyl-CoA carboxylase beta subunit
MGGEQAAETMAIVAEAGAARKGKPMDPAKLQEMKSRIINVFDSQMDVFATSGRLLDDGVIDPRDTRAVLLNVLAICREAEQRNPQKSVLGGAAMSKLTPFRKILIANRARSRCA